MKVKVILFSAALLCAGMLLGKNVFSQEGGMGQDDPQQAEMMKKWMEAATPGENHKVLNAMLGKWDTTSKMWMAGPDGPAEESKGSAEVKWILDGRFIQEEVSGSMAGMPFKGIATMGYDNFKKLYVSSWIDTLGTALYTSTGTIDADKKVITMEGLMDEPMTGEKDKKVQYIHKIVDKDKHVMEVHDMALAKMGKGTRVVEITYTRKK